MNKILAKSSVTSLLLPLLAATAIAAIAIENTDPADGDTLSRPPRTLRVWLTEEPDVSQSELRLKGPDGELELQGLHTMGYNDLMVRIVGRMPDGEYTVEWTAVGSDGETRSGQWKFTVKRGG